MTWQPIETAPKDGTRILLYFHDINKYQIGQYIIEDIYRQGKLERHSEGWRWPYDQHESNESMTGGYNNITPTLWCHIPKLDS